MVLLVVVNYTNVVTEFIGIAGSLRLFHVTESISPCRFARCWSGAPTAGSCRLSPGWRTSKAAAPFSKNPSASGRRPSAGCRACRRPPRPEPSGTGAAARSPLFLGGTPPPGTIRLVIGLTILLVAHGHLLPGWVLSYQTRRRTQFRLNLYKTNRQIDKIMNRSVKTVDTHRSHLMRKLNIHDQTTLVKFVLSRGIVGLG